ncbi:MAG: hypothetical protein V7641_1099 [Blastocatellia bacterium]
MSTGRNLIVIVTVSLALVIPIWANAARASQQAENAQMNCDMQRALLLVGQQIEEARNLDNPNKQIPVLIRAAELLWSRQQKNARDILANAFDLAERRFKEKGDETRLEGRMILQGTDLRFAVLEAIARHDAAWAKQLAERVAEETRRDAERDAETAKREAAKAVAYAPSLADKTLRLAESLASVDAQAAVGLARGALRYPANEATARFLFSLAAANPTAADQFYAAALAAYANAPVGELLYLSAYPFARNRIIGPEALQSYCFVPPAFVPNPRLQQLFIETLIRRAESSLKSPEQTAGGTFRLPEAAQLVIALTQLEALLPQFQPAYLERITALKPALTAMLNADTRQQAGEQLQQQTEYEDGGEFARNLDKAERESNPSLREQYYAYAILHAPESESLERVLGFLKKIDDAKLRGHLSNFIYFKRTQQAIKDKQLDDAARLAANVEQLDLRAYLAYEIASASLKEMQDRTRAREILDEVVKQALKAANSNEKARTLLGVAHLYAKFDSLRAFEVMREAIKTINQISEPNFASASVGQQIEGQRFGYYVMYPVEGFSLEKAFGLLAPFDFDGALLMARSFDDKSLRATASLALAAVCLENAAKAKKPNDAKAPASTDSQEKPAKPASKKRNP